MVEFQEVYFEHLALAVETGLFDALAHPDLIKNIRPEAWQPSLIASSTGRQARGLAPGALGLRCRHSLDTALLLDQLREAEAGLA